CAGKRGRAWEEGNPAERKAHSTGVKGPRRNLGVELQSMQTRGNSQTERACRDQRERDASADNSCRVQIMAPRPGDDADNESARNAEKHCGCQFTTKRRRKPIPGYGD